jgi:uncharacterized membrane protein
MSNLIDLRQRAADVAWLWGPAMLILWVATVALVIWLVVRTTRPREETSLQRAREILTRRYEQGELTEEEYRQRLDRLS